MLKVIVQEQPDAVSCGPVCLHAIYSYYEDRMSLQELISEISSLETGGTIGVFLGCHALRRGYQVTMNSVNTHVVDPSWFNLSHDNLIQKLRHQLTYANDARVIYATKAYIQFLELGGKISFSNLSVSLLETYLKKGIPLLSGVNCTWFYQQMREYTNLQNDVLYDEWLGKPCGHFIIIYKIDPQKEMLSIADPNIPNPLSNHHYYKTHFSHWLHAHLLGIMTYDAELLAITK